MTKGVDHETGRRSPMIVHRTLTTWQAATDWNRAIPGGRLAYDQAMGQLQSGRSVSRWAWPPDKRLFLSAPLEVIATGHLDLERKTEVWSPWEPTAEDEAAIDWVVWGCGEGWHADLEPIRDGVCRLAFKTFLPLFGMTLRKYRR